MIFGQQPFNISSSSAQSGTPEINDSGDCLPLIIPKVGSNEDQSTEDGVDFESSNETSLVDAIKPNLFGRYCPGFVSEDAEPVAPVARPVILLEGGGRIYDLCDEDTDSTAGSSTSADEPELDDFGGRENTETQDALTCDELVCTDGSINGLTDILLDLDDFGAPKNTETQGASTRSQPVFTDGSTHIIKDDLMQNKYALRPGSLVS